MHLQTYSIDLTRVSVPTEDESQQYQPSLMPIRPVMKYPTHAYTKHKELRHKQQNKHSQP
jgi:hypothetical protein